MKACLDESRSTAYARRFLQLLEIYGENPGLPVPFIHGALMGFAEVAAGLDEPVDWSVA